MRLLLKHPCPGFKTKEIHELAKAVCTRIYHHNNKGLSFFLSHRKKRERLWKLQIFFQYRKWVSSHRISSGGSSSSCHSAFPITRHEANLYERRNKSNYRKVCPRKTSPCRKIPYNQWHWFIEHDHELLYVYCTCLIAGLDRFKQILMFLSQGRQKFLKRDPPPKPTLLRYHYALIQRYISLSE